MDHGIGHMIGVPQRYLLPLGYLTPKIPYPFWDTLPPLGYPTQLWDTQQVPHPPCTSDLGTCSNLFKLGPIHPQPTNTDI